MKKNQEQGIEEKSSQFRKTDEDLSSENRDLKILKHINKRKEENDALKKLLENLNTSIPDIKKKSTKKS